MFTKRRLTPVVGVSFVSLLVVCVCTVHFGQLSDPSVRLLLICGLDDGSQRTIFFPAAEPMKAAGGARQLAPVQVNRKVPVSVAGKPQTSGTTSQPLGGKRPRDEAVVLGRSSAGRSSEPGFRRSGSDARGSGPGLRTSQHRLSDERRLSAALKVPPTKRSVELAAECEALLLAVEKKESSLAKMLEVKAQLQSVVETQLDERERLLESIQRQQVEEDAASLAQVAQLRAAADELVEATKQLLLKEASLADAHASLVLEHERILAEQAVHRATLDRVTLERSHAEGELSRARDELMHAEQELHAVEHTTHGLSRDAAAIIERINAHHAATKSFEQEAVESEVERRRLFCQYEELKGTIRVYCRVRGNVTTGATSSASGLAKFTFREDDPTQLEVAQSRDNATSTGRRDTSANFSFDRVFPPTSNQSEVFEEVCPLVDCAVDGYKVCIFAYGQTGSGKTHTMEGTPQDGGIIPRAIEHVFLRAKELLEDAWEYTVTCNFIEIYNETIRDLLETSDAYHRAFLLAASGGGGDAAAPPRQHEIQHRGKTDTVVTNIKERTVTSAQDVRQLLELASSNRSVAKTLLNDRSSRSHSVFTLRIDGVNRRIQQRSSGVLCLVDLAGSERVNDSGAQGQQLKEAIAINKSLMHLGDCIQSLGSRNSVVAWRNSKLTFLLQNFLSGDGSKMLMIVAASDREEHVPETLNALRFASKVNNTQIAGGKKRITPAASASSTSASSMAALPAPAANE